MKYLSTRGGVQHHDFSSVLLTGLATDGGLFVPATMPVLDTDRLDTLRTLPYADLATCVLDLFAGGSIPREDIDSAVRGALSRFTHPALAPIRQLHDQRWVMELFHGPTLAFKDYALQIVGELIERQLALEGRRATIMCATSGDTGAAAAAAFAGRDNVEVVVLHPHGRVSEVQRRQMTTLPQDNVHNFAVDGDFDTCQAMVKSLFLDPEAHSLHLTAVNSINWARIVCQVIYYAWAASRLCGPGKVNFVVPTGNFGNILAADVARRLGFPVGALVLSSNENDVLPRLLDTGTMQRRDTLPTLSPSMDIQVSSNFERALWDALEGDANAVTAAQEQLSASGSYTLERQALQRLRTRYQAVRCDREQALAEIKRCFTETGEILCPHTATAAHAARGLQLDGPVVVVGTAHPAKFPDAVAQAIGHAAPQPASLAPRMSAPERLQRINADVVELRDTLLARLD